ncbi:MAG: hypothetical protein JWP81_3843 [Ferruginibacter sp.]|nr:hypothetical protein [Ferruginibacter sp.]
MALVLKGAGKYDSKGRKKATSNQENKAFFVAMLKKREAG